MPTLSAGASTALAPVDPLAALAGGRYRDAMVDVASVGSQRPRRTLTTVRTPHFDLQMVDGVAHVDHVLAAEQIDDDVAGLIAEELFLPGWLRGVTLFERVFTGVVRSMQPDPVAAWRLFYRNTLARLGEEQARGEAGVDGADAAEALGGGHGTIAEYAPVYAHAERLLTPGSVLETGCCFGFFALQLAHSGRPVTAADLSAGTVRLLGRMAQDRGVELATVCADAAHHPFEDKRFDNVVVLHLLEHVEADHGLQILREAVRLARRRVVVAVPLEDVAEETWGHVRTISLADLDVWGDAGGLPYEVHEHHGGWLVIDT